MTVPFDSDIFKATRLIRKGLKPKATPADDAEYRELLAYFRANSKFQEIVEQACAGLDLRIIDMDEKRGIYIVPTNAESPFAFKLSHIRTRMSEEEKAGLALAHFAIAKSFFPSTDLLENDDHLPPPSSFKTFRDNFHVLAKSLKEQHADQKYSGEDRAAWDFLSSIAIAIPDSDRAALSSLSGMIKLALKHLQDHGLLKLMQGADDETAQLYTPTKRFRVQLREQALQKAFEILQKHSASTELAEAKQ